MLRCIDYGESADIVMTAFYSRGCLPQHRKRSATARVLLDTRPYTLRNYPGILTIHAATIDGFDGRVSQQ
jgi:hypothetical protein